MSKFSQKPTNQQQQHTLPAVTSVSGKSNVVKKVVNKFKGMAERLEFVEPVIIPGYKIRG
jgi:hypothetical protein